MSGDEEPQDWYGIVLGEKSMETLLGYHRTINGVFRGCQQSHPGCTGVGFQLDIVMGFLLRRLAQVETTALESAEELAALKARVAKIEKVLAQPLNLMKGEKE